MAVSALLPAHVATPKSASLPRSMILLTMNEPRLEH
jgi:hypothetical protein